MTRAVPRRRAALAVGAAALLVGAAAAAAGTWARFSDADPGAGGGTASATVVFGGRSTPPAIAFTGIRAGSTTTQQLTVDYRGSVPATLSLSLPATTSTACTSAVAGLLDAAGVGSLVVTAGSRAGESYCSLLDGRERVVAVLAPNTVTSVPVTVTVGAVVLVPRTEVATVRVQATGGFTDRVDGTLRIGTTLPGPRSLRAAAVPVAAPTVAPAPITPPAECVQAGIGTVAETVTLSAAAPVFDAARDRPGADGPFLVVGTAGPDTVVGSPGRDCVIGAGGADVVDGGPGDDVLVGGDGDDRLAGGAGADALYGNAGADTLRGGPEVPVAPDRLYGGPDGADCPDAGPEDVLTACTSAPAGDAATPGSAAPEPTEGTPPPAATPPRPQPQPGAVPDPAEAPAVPPGGAEGGAGPGPTVAPDTAPGTVGGDPGSGT